MSLAPVASLLAAFLLLSGQADAQLRRPRATVTPAVEKDGVFPGTTARIAVDVLLPEGLHVQSDRPRDPSLIPTVLQIDPPAGVTVTAVAYPTPFDFAQENLSQPLAVFGSRFAIGATVGIPANAPSGDLVIAGQLRYQACDDKVHPPRRRSNGRCASCVLGHRRYGVSSTPTLVLVDRSGVVRLYHPGKMSQDTLEPFVRRLVEGSSSRFEEEP